MVEKKQENDSKTNHNNVQVIGPSPAKGRVLNKGSSNLRSKGRDWCRYYKYSRHDHRTILVGHQLSNSNTKAQLDAFANSVHHACNDEGINILRGGSHNYTNECYAISANK